MKPEDSHAAADISMGLIAGAVAAGATTPLDVVKTRMMCNASQRPSFAGAIAGVWRDSPPGMGRAKTFFTGVGPRAFNGINGAIFFCFFEQLRVVFKQQDESAALQREARELRRRRSRWTRNPGRRGRAATRARAATPSAPVYTTAKRQMRVTEASMAARAEARRRREKSDFFAKMSLKRHTLRRCDDRFHYDSPLSIEWRTDRRVVAQQPHPGGRRLLKVLCFHHTVSRRARLAKSFRRRDATARAGRPLPLTRASGLARLPVRAQRARRAAACAAMCFLLAST